MPDADSANALPPCPIRQQPVTRLAGLVLQIAAVVPARPPQRIMRNAKRATLAGDHRGFAGGLGSQAVIDGRCVQRDPVAAGVVIQKM